MSLEAARAALAAQVGEQVHVSDWIDVTQERIDAFAAATGDFQWIHTDPERAKRESPWKGTIAHGFLTLSLLPLLRGVATGGEARFPGVRRIVNYGLNRVRFTNAVPAGARVRGRARIVAVEDFRGGLQLTEEITIEIDGQTRPACVAETIARLYF
ncbi:MAG TPA: MaoC family dehydratase [Steroidobacteraceae bacterium]|nr:MaoC family dehydratase [Steroidobacteraceae bacterium]